MSELSYNQIHSFCFQAGSRKKTNIKDGEQMSGEQMSGEQMSGEQMSVSICRSEQMSGEQMSGEQMSL